MKRTSKETEEKIIKYYSEGHSFNETGSEFGISPVTAYNIIKRYNIGTRTKGGIYPLPTKKIVNINLGRVVKR